MDETKEALEIFLKAQQVLLEKAAEDAARLSRSLKDMSANYGYAIDLLVKQEEGR